MKNIGCHSLCKDVQIYCIYLKIAILYSLRIKKRLLGKIAYIFSHLLNLWSIAASFVIRHDLV
jgi:hypothetical protein